MVRAVPNIKLAAFSERIRKSFEIAFRFVLENEGWQLVHGRLSAGTDHAWCELERDWVYEPESNRLYEWKSFRQSFSYTESVRYACGEAISNFLTFETYGPWHSAAINLRPHSVVMRLLRETIRAEQVTDISVARLVRRLTRARSD